MSSRPVGQAVQRQREGRMSILFEKQRGQIGWISEYGKGNKNVASRLECGFTLFIAGPFGSLASEGFARLPKGSINTQKG